MVGLTLKTEIPVFLSHVCRSAWSDAKLRSVGQRAYQWNHAWLRALSRSRCSIAPQCFWHFTGGVSRSEDNKKNKKYLSKKAIKKELTWAIMCVTCIGLSRTPNTIFPTVKRALACASPLSTSAPTSHIAFCPGWPFEPHAIHCRKKNVWQLNRCFLWQRLLWNLKGFTPIKLIHDREFPVCKMNKKFYRKVKEKSAWIKTNFLYITKQMLKIF